MRWHIFFVFSNRIYDNLNIFQILQPRKRETAPPKDTENITLTIKPIQKHMYKMMITQKILKAEQYIALKSNFLRQNFSSKRWFVHKLSVTNAPNTSIEIIFQIV